jgi:hypothetical protein
MKIKIIERGSTLELENAVNNFLEQNTSDILDIKYSGGTSYSIYSLPRYSAMIIIDN